MREIDGKSINGTCCKLSLLEIRTLLFIKKHKSVKPMDISKEFGVTPATVTVQIDRLVKKGCVERKSNKDDGRSIIVLLTEKAEKQLNKITNEKLKSYDAIFKNLTQDDQRKLLKLMEKMESGTDRKDKEE
jgi:DNA-binding MarR family transcriptional regulator